ncbi:MAG: hypothetical protein M1830_002405, partial [Pleopsidium flavum]
MTLPKLDLSSNIRLGQPGVAVLTTFDFEPDLVRPYMSSPSASEPRTYILSAATFLPSQS